MKNNNIKDKLRVMGLRVTRLCNKFLLSNLNEQRYLQGFFKQSANANVYEDLSNVKRVSFRGEYY